MASHCFPFGTWRPVCQWSKTDEMGVQSLWFGPIALLLWYPKKFKKNYLNFLCQVFFFFVWKIRGGRTDVLKPHPYLAFCNASFFISLSSSSSLRVLHPFQIWFCYLYSNSVFYLVILFYPRWLSGSFF